MQLFFVEKYLFIKTDLLEAAGLSKNFLDGFLQSLSFPNDAGVKDVIPGYLCTIDKLGQGTFQYSSGVPWFWSSKSEDLAW